MWTKIDSYKTEIIRIFFLNPAGFFKKQTNLYRLKVKGLKMIFQANTKRKSVWPC